MRRGSTYMKEGIYLRIKFKNIALKRTVIKRYKTNMEQNRLILQNQFSSSLVIILRYFFWGLIPSLFVQLLLHEVQVVQVD